MVDLKIERLRLNLNNAAGHEHRLQPIALRAVRLLAERLGGPHAIATGRQFADLTAEPLDLPLHLLSDEQAAEGVATAWANALTAKPNGQRLRN